MSKQPHIRHFTKVSGAQLGKSAKRIAGCECCNFMEQAFAKGHTLHKEGHKTGATCTRCGNPTVRVFDSQAEFHRACELRLMKDKGLITSLSYQVKYSLKVNDKHLCFYVADFTYIDSTGVFVVEDVKNKSMVVTEIALHKMKHFELQYDLEVSIVGR